MRYVKTEDQAIRESSWGRIIQHMEGSDVFAVISPYLRKLSDEENDRRAREMKKVVRSMGYGYIPMDAGYEHQDTGGIGIEESLFIPQITKEDAMELGRRYDQESILFKDRDGFHLIMSDTGMVDTTFQATRRSDGRLTFDPEVTKSAFGQLRRSSRDQGSERLSHESESRDAAKSFTVRAYKGPNRTDAYRALKTGEYPTDVPVSLREYLKGKK